MDEKLEFKINQFEGPLDLLLHLIDKNKFNIFDIPIVEITEQYLDCDHRGRCALGAAVSGLPESYAGGKSGRDE